MDFEVKFKLTDKMYKDYVYKILCHNIKIFGIILLIIAMELILFCFNYEKEFTWIFIICFIFILLVLILYPFSVYKRLLEYDKIIHNGKKYDAIVSFDDEVRFVEGKQKITVAYEQIKSIYRIDDMVVLMFNSQNGIIVDLSDFVVGDKKHFFKYILKKCKRVKRIIER